MSIKKRNIMEFVSRVKSKAENSIRGKYSELIKERTNEILVKSGLSEYMQEMENISTKMMTTLIDMGYKYDNFPHNLRNSFSGLPSSYLNIFSFVQDTKYQYLVKEMGDLLIDCRSSYKSIENTIDKMTKVKDMIAYLKGLGFDTAWLNQFEEDKDVVKEALQTSKINKEALFPCGDNK